MPGFVENVNTVALGLTPGFIQNVADVVSIQGAISTVAADALSVVSVATNVVPNMAEILLADTNAGIATTQAGIASAAAAAAGISEQNTTSLLDQFDDRYLGSKAITPLVDNDGNGLLVGALYWDTVMNKLQIWDGVLWSDALTLTETSISDVYNKTIDSITNTIGANHIHYPIRNITGSTIPKGTVVHAHATQPGTDYITVEPMTNPGTEVALGIAHSDIPVNGTGLCMNTGLSADTVNTSGWVVGTMLYPAAGGGLTSVRPTTGQYQACAVVLRSHATQGTLLVEFTEPKYIASTTQSGYVQLNDTLTSTSTTEALTAAQGKTLQDNKQPLDATLTALSGIVTTVDDMIYATGVDTFSTSSITAFGRSLIDDIDAATARTTLGAENASMKGAINGYAPLDTNAQVPAINLPSYVDDVLEVATYSALPITGTAGIIYIVVADETSGGDTSSYRWTGTVYAMVSNTLTAIDILNLLKTVDGATSGLDADLLDGKHAPTGDIVGTTDTQTLSNKTITGPSFNSITGLATVNPIMDGTAAAGVSTLTAREDHVHPSDTTKSDVATTVQKDSSTGAAYLPVGTTAQRPVTPANGYMRYNTDLISVEVYSNGAWGSVGGGATGGGTDHVFVNTEYTINSSYLIPAGKSSVIVSDSSNNVYFAAGVQIDFSTGSKVVIL